MKCIKSPTPYLLFLGVLFLLTFVNIPKNNQKSVKETMVSSDKNIKNMQIAYNKN